MKTDELIVDLARRAAPVTPLASPAIRTARWLTLASAVAGVAIVAIGPRADLASAVTRPAFLVSFLALAVAAVASSAIALAMSVPGALRSPRARALPVAAAVAWVAIWLAMMATSPASHAHLFHLGCAAEIAALSVVCGWVLVLMLRRAAPLQPAWTAAVAAIAAVTVGAGATQVICPIDDPAHQVVAHVLVAGAVGLVAFGIGRRQLAGRR